MVSSMFTLCLDSQYVCKIFVVIDERFITRSNSQKYLIHMVMIYSYFMLEMTHKVRRRRLGGHVGAGDGSRDVTLSDPPVQVW